ncbi:hypothetical protein HDU67_006071 [Dinochytrium kinnereticum]|nr:hypothetical protein HDU67_006071 [Dinochytrium kinnereticum]
MAPVPSTTPAPIEYDIVVIGSGAGSKITRPAANLGYKVAIVEKGPLGGTCLNRGCIPSKMLIHPADVISAVVDEAPKFGINVHSSAPVSIDKAKLVKDVCESIDEDSASIAPVYEKHPNITLYAGEGFFVGEKVIQVNNQVISGKKIFITTGCRAHVPELPGLEGTPYVTYEQVLRMTDTPKSMIVLGGGYIGTELGYYMAMTGTKVDFVVRSRMLSAEDPEIRDVFEQSFKERFNVHLHQKPISVSHVDSIFTLKTLDDTGKEHIFTAEQLFVATGVTPNSDILHLPSTIKTNEKGFIIVDESFQTTAKDVYAFGDVIGRNLFRHTANWEGEWVFKNIIKLPHDGVVSSLKATYPPVPHAVFTNPQVAGVGMTEPEAVGKYGINALVIGRSDVADCAMGQALRAKHGMVKLIFLKDGGKLVGAHMVGEQASTVIHMCIAYMQMGAKLDDILETIFIHPALHEVVRNAARDAREQMVQ